MFITIKNHLFNVDCISSARISESGCALYIITTNDREHTIDGEGKNLTEKRAEIKKIFEDFSKNLSKTS